MGINFVFILTILILGLSGFAGYKIGTAKLVFACIVIVLGMIIAGIFDSGIYMMLDFAGIDKAMYSATRDMVFTDVDAVDRDEFIEKINSHTAEQMRYIENLALPYSVKLSMMENNNSKAYEYMRAENFVEYSGKFFAYAILCVISYGISIILSMVAVAFILKWIKIDLQLLSEKAKGKETGIVLGLVFGMLIIFILFSGIPFISGTKVGGFFYRQVRASRILSMLYDNNIIIKLFLMVKPKIWVAGK